jgi:ATP-dependent Clp protease adapter protein ClpS
MSRCRLFQVGKNPLALDVGRFNNQIHYEGQAIVWVGPQEMAELYHQQLRRAGLTMAPLEAA